MSDQHSRPGAEEGPDAHHLGPPEFDRAELVYYATCRCGRRFGPARSLDAVRAEFDRHLAAVTDTPDPGGGHGT